MNVKRPPMWLVFPGIVVIIGVIVWMAIARNGDQKTTSLKFKDIPVQKGTFQILVSANGVVQPINRIEIKSKASGQVVELPVEEGDAVKKGALIARLDQKDERADLAQAQANLDIARAELTQAQRSFDRRDQLFQRNLISEEERDEIELSLAVAKGKLVQASTALERAQERLAESVVRAPVDGIILQKYVEEGQIIASGVSTVGGGSPIVDLADMNSVYVEAGVDEVDIGKIRVDQVARVTAEAYPNLKFEGKVVRIAPEAKIEQNVTLFDVIVKVENTDHRLKSGMNTTLEITIEHREQVLMAPLIALQIPRRPGAKPSQREVLLKQDDGYMPHTVEIGLSNFQGGHYNLRPGGRGGAGGSHDIPPEGRK